MKNKERGCFVNFTPDSEVYREFADWGLDDCKDLLNKLNSKIYGQPEMKKLVTAIWSYIQQLVSFQEPRSNVVIKGPSHCGKALTYKVIKEYFREAIPDLPVLKVNAFELSIMFDGEGEFQDLLAPLYYSECSEPAAIIFVDEANLCFDAFGYSVCQTRVLQKIVSSLRDKSIYFSINDGPRKMIRTDNVMFIFTGNFEDEDEDDDDYFSKKAELLDSFPFEIEFFELTEDTIRQIINNKTREISMLTGMEITIAEKYMTKFVSDIHKNQDWLRVFRKIEHEVMKIYSEQLFTDAMSPKYTISITIDEETSFINKKK